MPFSNLHKGTKWATGLPSTYGGFVLAKVQPFLTGKGEGSVISPLLRRPPRALLAVWGHCPRGYRSLPGDLGLSPSLQWEGDHPSAQKPWGR